MASQDQIIEGAKKIKQAIEDALANGKPLLIGRHGSHEFQCCGLALRNPELKALPKAVVRILHKNGGVFPEDSGIPWFEEYWSSTKQADGMATGWFPPTANEERRLVSLHNPTAFQFPLRSLEPYYVEANDRWTSILKGRRVCIVSSFAKSIEHQIIRTHKIWPYGEHESLVPDAEYSFVRTYFPPEFAGPMLSWPQGISKWQEAVHYVVAEVEKNNPEVTLIGCGALGMIIAVELKKRGRIAIYMGGAIQILFGVKGRRWLEHDIISKFFNEYWIQPSNEEIPEHAMSIERGCYW